MNLLRLIFPEKCRACGSFLHGVDPPLCPSCRNTYEFEKRRICPTCRRIQLECRCRATYDNRSIVEYASLFRYRKNTPGGRLILSIKERKDLPTLELLSRDMAKLLEKRQLLTEDTVFVYVPRSQKTKRLKGVDQSLELAEQLSGLLSLPVVNVLQSGKSKIDQKDLTALQRKAHTTGLYSFCGSSDEISGKRVILVDDICTSGATLSACAAILKSNGAKEIVALTAGKSR